MVAAMETLSGWDVFWSYASPVILAGLFFMCVHSLWQRARRVPAAQGDRPSGVKGALLAVTALILAGCLWRVAEALNVLSYINGLRGGNASWGEFLRFGLPGVTSAVLLWNSTWKLTLERTPKALLHAVAALWIGGPAIELVKPAFYNTTYDEELWCAAALWLLLALVASLYLYLAPRSRHTYGLQEHGE